MVETWPQMTQNTFRSTLAGSTPAKSMAAPHPLQEKLLMTPAIRIRFLNATLHQQAQLRLRNNG